MVTYLLHTNTDSVQLLVRVTLGVVFFSRGAQKMPGWFQGSGLKNSINNMNENRHIPAALCFVAITAEFFGGLGLIVGLFSRIAAAAVVVAMLAAIVLVPSRHCLFLDWFGDRKSHGYEYRLLAIALASGVVVRGLRRSVSGSPSLP